jgi:hypothetical protein
MIGLPLFEMLQTGVNHFLDPTQFGAPCIFRVVESSIHVSPEIAEPGIQIRNAGIQIRNAEVQIAKPRVVDEDSNEYCDRGNANGKSDLNCLIGHRFIQNTPSRPALTLFKMLQACVNHFLDPMELGSPSILSVVEPLIDGVESSVHMSSQIAKSRIQISNAGIQIAKPRIVNENPHEYSNRGNASGKSDLNSLIGHRCLQNTSF